MIAKFEFDFKEYEDIELFEAMSMAMNMRNFIWDFKEELRQKIKHGASDEKEAEIYEKIADRLHELMNDRNIRV